MNRPSGNFGAWAVCTALLAPGVLHAAETRSEQSQPPARVYGEMPQAPGAQLSDEQIETQIVEALRSDALVSPDTITIEAGAGTVTLSGSQPIVIARERAADIAQRIPGVHRVVNEIQIRPRRAVSGNQLAQQIEYALRTDPALEGHKFRVQATDAGAVVLSGVVDSRARQYIAGHVVKSMNGVTSFREQIQVRRPAQRSDEEIAADVRRMLQWQATDDVRAPDVSVESGVVTLSGEVANETEKRRVVGLSWVAGVKHVNMRPLRVANVEPGHGDPAPGADLELESDEAIAQAVRKEIAQTPQLEDADIQVSVENGVVTLSGEVSDPPSKQAARKIPYGLLGVASVEDNIAVRRDAVAHDE